ncbi:LysR family transcriptional regulator [Streptomyces tubbatahanensis]|uniref:LysR family transcriptional regulator n=1 Tax=Streptomyces tubbatahanensis TaxID=2923272 RepID=A0ABY3XLR3_9ACTN|nr:LysR family transcriptional regulator [Streptomyces tubbatahanensis]UNS95335.1 LysR family transcriptional regulator [Streptomyces tubbatahanensis]
MEYQAEWLGSFVGVAERGGFSAAATALSRSQSRVSAHVAALERALDIRLFDRSAHPTVLTPQGRALLPHARTALRHLRSLAGTAADIRRGRRGEVRLGVHTSIAPFLLPRTVLRVRRSHPGLRLTVCEHQAAELEHRLLDGRLDLAVSPGAVPGSGGGALAGVPLWHEHLLAVVPEDTAVELPGVLGPEHLRGRPLVVLDDEAPGAVSLPVHGAFRGTAVGNGPVLRSPQAQTLVGLVRQGWGIGVGEALALSTADTRGVALCPVTGLPPGRDIALWRRAGDHPAPAREAVAHCVRIAAVPALARVREYFPTPGSAP